MKFHSVIFLFILFISCGQADSGSKKYFPRLVEKANPAPSFERTWVFVLAGQSNMAGRGLVEANDTIPNKRIFSFDSKGDLIYAKEPLHFYEPGMTGLDCGMSFGNSLLEQIPDSISILLVPTAVGGSSIEQWLGDSTHRKVKLMSNFREKMALAQKTGTIKAVLWHQGESDANAKDLPAYAANLQRLISDFRNTIGNAQLPVIIGELGSFSKDSANWKMINENIRMVAGADTNIAVIATSDLKDVGDKIHFDSKGQRSMGMRMAQSYLSKFK